MPTGARLIPRDENDRALSGIPGQGPDIIQADYPGPGQGPGGNRKATCVAIVWPGPGWKEFSKQLRGQGPTRPRLGKSYPAIARSGPDR